MSFHVAVWHQVLQQTGIDVPQWRIHRAVDMSGSFFLPKLLRDFVSSDGRALVNQLEVAHKRLFGRTIPKVRRFAGVPELLQTLRRSDIKFAMATSGGLDHTNQLLRTVKLASTIPVLTGDDVESAKPRPIFLNPALRTWIARLLTVLSWGTVCGMFSRLGA